MQIAIVNLGVGNLRSVEQAVRSVAAGAHVHITNQAADIEQADRVVLPGQGAVGTWFSQLEQYNLKAALTRAFDEKPTLGICVGMQALFEHCHEDGGRAGLGLFSGEVQHFSKFHTSPLKIPQMGWNTVKQTREHPLWHGITQDAYFYFVHSFCANTDDAQAVCGVTDYGHEFVAAIARGFVFATQFHPEKSHDDGLRLIKNFVSWNGER